MASPCFPDGQNVTHLLVWIFFGGVEVSSEPSQKRNPQFEGEGILPMVGVSSSNGAGVSPLNAESHFFSMMGINPFSWEK